MKNLLTGAILTLAVLFNVQSVQAATLFDYSSEWGYYQASGSEYTWKYSTNFYSANINSFDWSKITNTGLGAFGNTGSYKSTYWAANTGLALEKTINIEGLISNPVLNYGIDNGIIVFINDVEAFRLNEEGGGFRNEHKIALDASLFNVGQNTIKILAEDHGGGTWVDFQLLGDVTPVPEPSSMLLGFMGISSLLGFRRKN